MFILEINSFMCSPPGRCNYPRLLVMDTPGVNQNYCTYTGVTESRLNTPVYSSTRSRDSRYIHHREVILDPQGTDGSYFIDYYEYTISFTEMIIHKMDYLLFT
jgi:hypothetical protein